MALCTFALALLLFVYTRTPSLDRSWDEDVNVLAGVDTALPEKIKLTRIRDWQYSDEEIVAKPYFDASFNPSDIQAMWIYEQQLGRLGLIAHTFVVFEFDESYGRGRYLGLSVETRREMGEKYSLLGGILRQFEITHIWSTEQDLVTRRVQFLDYPLTRYRLDIPKPYHAAIFRSFVGETQHLAADPRWYNTVTNNCTSSLVKYVNKNEPDAIPLHYSYVFTGKMDEYLEKLGYKNAEYSLHITKDFLASNPLRP
ncbi:MAG: DUF4105 domain-containing protein [Pseudomonadota bacterium]